MKKKLIAVFILSLFMFMVGCNGKSGDTQDKKETSLETQKEEEKNKEQVFAKYRVNIYKNKNLTGWVATLAKGEKVILKEVFTPEKNNKKTDVVDVAKIVRADGETTGYLERRHLTGKPIIIVKNNLKVYEQPTITSTVFTRVNEGTVAFIQDKKDNWVKIFIGYVEFNDEKKYVEGKWIKEGFSDDITLVQEGLVYDRALNQLEDKKMDNDKKAKAALEELTESQSIYSELAKETIMDYESEEMMD